MAAPTESVTLRVPVDVLEQVESIASATDRSRSYIIVRALRAYIMNEGSDILDAIKGREQVQAGDFEKMEDLIREVDRIAAGKVA